MNKKKKVRHSGKLKSYMQWPAVVAVLLVMLDILVFAIDVKAGFLVFCFTAAYWVLMSVLMLRYRPFVLREMIAFASQYSQIQKGMLKNFSIPYAVLDTDGRVLWMNDAFCDVTGKDSRYRKNISNLFPEIDASALPFIGTGTILLPWAALELFRGDFFHAAAYLTFFLITNSTRDFLEPRLLGEKLGVYPIVIAVVVYVGICIFGPTGVLLGPLMLLVIREVVREWLEA